MNDIYYNLDTTFPFDQLSLAAPRSMQGGGYFSKIFIDTDTPFLFQTPKCYTKKGIIKTEKKTYCDLLFNSDNNEFVQWFDKFEKSIHGLIYNKREDWFDNDITLDDIDYLFNSSLRTYQSKKFLIRCFVKQPKYIKSVNTLQIFDEEENAVNLDDITPDKGIIGIVEVLGIKYTNGGASFNLELCLRQIMTFSEKKIFNKCLIHTKMKKEKKEDVKEDVKELEKEDDEKPTKEDEKEPEKEDVETDEPVKEDKEQIKNEVAKEIEKQSTNSKKLKIVDSIDMGPMKDSLEELSEIKLDVPEESSISLKKPKDVYYKIWREAREKAKAAKKVAIQAYLEAKKIKNAYLLDEIESSDDDLDNLDR